jgi:hypothetical protein
MTVESLERHLVRSGYTADEGVYRHPKWLGWVRWSDDSLTWRALDANGVRRNSGNLSQLLRDSGAPALVGVPS